MATKVSNYQVQMQAEEYRSLREEINMIIKRGYDIYFSSLALSIALLGYGITIYNSNSISVPIVVLIPVFLLHLGFK